MDDLKMIKRDYGEKMSHLCRELFSTILETPGLLYKIISEHFAKSKSLYYDIMEDNKQFIFKEYIYHFCDIEEEKKDESTKTVKDLLDEKEYVLYECKTNEDVQKFKKYYASGEELCTFRDSMRINDYYIFFIVKKDVDKIRRNDFVKPKREDKYSTSVLDLQFDKGSRQRVSIKSRYNHTVKGPDATYSNNLDFIVSGLTEAFERDYGFNIGGDYKSGFELKDYVKANDGKYYKYNYEINNINYCSNNIIIDRRGKVVDTYSDKSRYTFIDYFILDEVEKKIIVYDNQIYDSFKDNLNNIKNIDIRNKEDYKEIRLTLEEDKEAIIKLDKRGRIIGYKNDNLKSCGPFFLGHNEVLKELDLPNLVECNSGFLSYNEELEYLNLPNLVKCGTGFLTGNITLKELNLPNLIYCGDNFLFYNEDIYTLNCPKLEKCGDNFLNHNLALRDLNLPSLIQCGDGFLWYNQILEELNLPNLERCGHFFLYYNTYLKNISLPSLIKCDSGFLHHNYDLESIYLPKLNEGYYRCFKPEIIPLINNDIRRKKG